MPKIAKVLGALGVSRLLTGRHAVGGVAGLCLLVEPTGSRRWVCRILVAGKRRDYGLGSYPTVTLADAKEAARELRRQVNEGKDPAAERRAAKDALAANQASAKTFAECAAALIESRREGWRNAKHAAQWSSTLARYAFPIIGRKQVQEVTTEDILKILKPIWHTKTETATRLRGRIEKVFSWSISLGYRKGENPARLKDHLEHSLSQASKIKKVQHYPAMPYPEVSKFIGDLHKREGLAAKALEFGILTAARPGEVREARWSEFDLDAARWTVPAERMKNNVEHRVPLTKPALKILKTLDRTTTLVFPGTKKGRPLSDMTMTAVLRRMNIPQELASVHGFRSSFRDWAGEQTNTATNVIEMCLSHATKTVVEASYFRSDIFEKRRILLDQWGQYVSTQKTGKVVPFSRIYQTN